MNLEVSFERWKRLTALLQSENDTYDAVIERLLDSQSHAQVDSSLSVGASQRSEYEESDVEGASFKGVLLPNGTKLRAIYKGTEYLAEISEGRWVDSRSGQTRNSPSQAAYWITGGAVNGWLFWLVKRPIDQQWQSLNALRAEKWG